MSIQQYVDLSVELEQRPCFMNYAMIERWNMLDGFNCMGNEVKPFKLPKGFDGYDNHLIVP